MTCAFSAVRNQRLTGTLRATDRAKRTNEAIARIRRHQQFLVIAFHQHMLYGCPRRQRELPVSGSPCPRAEGSVMGSIAYCARW